MPDLNPPDSGGPLRRTSPAAVVIVFALAMTACVLGVVVWKSLEAKATTLARGQTDIENLAHSLAEHAAHAIRSADIAMAGMVDLLKYRDPLPERFNPYLAGTVSSLPQIREIGVFDVDGRWRYSSLPETPKHNNSDRSYFIYHRDTPGSALRINEPIQSRLTGRSTIILSKRIDRQDGSFGGVLTAAIDSDYFNRFYKTFQLGPDGSISLLRNDGAVLIRWPLSDRSTNLSGTDLFSRHLKLSSVGYYKIISPFDGITKYFGYEETPYYPTVVTLGDVGRLAARGLAEDAADRRHRCRRATVHDRSAGCAGFPADPLSHEDRTCPAQERGALPPARGQHRRYHHSDRCPQPAPLCFSVGRTGAGTAPEGSCRQVML
ncbi:hypothetical protein [Bradyrhizobium sp. URHC0002]